MKKLLEREPTSNKQTRADLIKCFGISNSRKSTEQVLNYVADDLNRFNELYLIFTGTNPHLIHFSTWSFTEIALAKPLWVNNYSKDLLYKLKDRESTVARTRAIARLFQWIDIPEAIEGPLYDYALAQVLNFDTPIAIKAYCMTICERIANRYEDLRSEVYLAIASQMDRGSSGLKSRGLKILKRWEKAGLIL